MIEKDIALRGQSGRKSGYPFREMPVGSSVLITGKTINRVSGAAVRVSKATGRKFTCRTVEGGVMVWRLS
jgi:hypothetical protein